MPKIINDNDIDAMMDRIDEELIRLRELCVQYEHTLAGLFELKQVTAPIKGAPTRYKSWREIDPKTGAEVIATTISSRPAPIGHNSGNQPLVVDSQKKTVKASWQDVRFPKASGLHSTAQREVAIRDMLKKAGTGLSSGDILMQLGVGGGSDATKQQKQQIYAAIGSLLRQKMIKRDENMRYVPTNYGTGDVK